MHSSQRYFNRVLVSLVVLILATRVSAEPKEKVLYSFQGGNDGATPVGGVVFDKSGNLYGATSWGGTICPSPGCGVVFQVSPPNNKGGAWTETVIYEFKGVQGGLGDGLTPVGGLIIDQQGNLYGTTSLGGNGPCILLGSPAGCGTVYELSPPAKKGGQWTEKILYNFQGGTDGYFPWGDLAFDTDGNLYGATQFGGGKGKSCNQFYGGNCGTVFKLSPPAKKNGVWKEKVLHHFAGGTDGANPNGYLILDASAVVYGLTTAGGNLNCNYGSGQVGCGVAFMLTPPLKNGASWSERLLHRFNRTRSDGGNPMSGLLLDSKGNLYGTTLNGGPGPGGIVFRLAWQQGKESWDETILYAFNGNRGSYDPESALIFDQAGNLYGTTYSGKASPGSVFRLKLSAPTARTWAFSLLHGFAGPPDGAQPATGLTLGKSGNLFGTTTRGGTGACTFGCGTVFEVEP